MHSIWLHKENCILKYNLLTDLAKAKGLIYIFLTTFTDINNLKGSLSKMKQACKKMPKHTQSLKKVPSSLWFFSYIQCSQSKWKTQGPVFIPSFVKKNN